MTQKKVVYLFGGPSVEHPVSVSAAKGVLSSFPKEFTLMPVFISKENRWAYEQAFVPSSEAWDVAESLMQRSGATAEHALDDIQNLDPYVVFIGLHGEFGEDGTLQALLEARGLPFTGSDSDASALAIDKPKVLQLLQDEDIRVPEFLEVAAATPEVDIRGFVEFVGAPMMLLPADSGSSLGVRMLHSVDEVWAAIGELPKGESGKNEPRYLLSQHIAGSEFSAGMLVTGPDELTALPPTEIVLIKNHAFWDYDAKYQVGECEEVTPAQREPELIARIQAMARKVHQLVGADGVSRTDMILGQDNELYVLEINTLPGMTPTSIIPAQAKAYGLNFSELIAVLCDNVDRSAGEYRSVDSHDSDADELGSF